MATLALPTKMALWRVMEMQQHYTFSSTYGYLPSSSAKELQVLLSPAVMVTLTMNAHTVPNAEINNSITEKKLILKY